MKTAEFEKLLSEALKATVTRPNANFYKPHAKQLLFHQATTQGRLYIGGNRSGKTVGGIVEDIYWMKGQHPYRKVPPAPAVGRIISVDFVNGVEKIIIPNLKQWVPPSLLVDGSWERSYSKQDRVLTCANGSVVDLMSYDQDTDKFAGVPRDFIHYDEEPPKHIFTENSMRLIDRAGQWWLTMTPVEGMTWIHDEIYEPGKDGLAPDITVIVVDLDDNPYLSDEGKRVVLAGLDDDTLAARKSGIFVTIGGKVYKKFTVEDHVIEPMIPPKSWTWYCSLDHGFNNPTAVLWHAVDPNSGRVVTFAEHYRSEWTIEQHATEILKKNKELGKTPDIYVGDPALAQRNAVNGTSIFTEYMMRGVPILPGNNDVDAGVARVAQYIAAKKWQVTENCTKLIWEMARLRWKRWATKRTEYENNPYEKINKKDDHACDSLRYFMCTFMPEILPSGLDVLAKLDRAIDTDNSSAVGAVQGVNPSQNYDQALAEAVRTALPKTIESYDEYVGIF